MSNGVLIELLSPLITDELTLPLQPDFASLVSDSLGNAADSSDGFDQVLADLVSIVDGLEGGLVALGGADGGDLDDAFVDILALDSDAPGTDVANLSAAIPDVQTNVDNLANLLTGAALPAPPQQGTGGMQVQTAIGPVLPCVGRQGFGSPGGCSGFPCISDVPFTNASGVQQTIASITLVQDSGGPWTVTTDAQPSFPAGQTYHLRITATRAPQPDETAQVQIALQGGTQPAVFCMDGGVGGTVPPSGGGGGPIVLQPA